MVPRPESSGDLVARPDTSRAGRTLTELFDHGAHVRQQKATDRIIESIRVAIASGRLDRGDRLPNERDLAGHFGVSQPTVREAVRVLETMGLIDVRHGSGAYVSGEMGGFISRSLQTLMQIEGVGILDVIELRKSLAQYSVARAVSHASDGELEQIAELEEALRQSSHEEDYRASSQNALQYLTALSAASHSPLVFAIESFLIELMLALQITAWLTDRTRFTEAWEAWHEPFDRDRRALHAALHARDATAAVAAMDQYLDDQHELFGAFQNLSELKINDVTVIEAVAEAGLTVPAYRDLLSADGQAQADT